MSAAGFKWLGLGSAALLVLSLADLVACAPVESSAGAAGQSGGAPGSAGSSNAGPCQPLDPITSPVTLDASDIIDAGRDADGTVYVLLSELRLFVSSGTTGAVLAEQVEHGAGGGQQGATQFWTFQYLDAQGMPVTIEVQQDSAGMRMGVVKGPIPGKGFDVGSVGDVLEPITPAAAAAMPAQTTQAFDVDFAGAGVGSDTKLNLVVTAPTPLEPDFGGFRVFLGPVGAFVEQAGPISVGRGSDTRIDFTSNGSPATFVYANGQQGTLTIGTESESILGSDQPVLPAGAVLICR